MKLKIFGVGICWLGLAAQAFAFTSRFSSMAVSGSAFTNYWTIASNMELVADNTWQGTQEITNGAGGFKFAAQNNWTFSWGGDVAVVRVPAAGRAKRDFIGNNLEFSRLAPGPYRFTFNDVTLDFRLDWNGAEPLPPPVFASLAVAGDFNAWAPAARHRLTNDPGDANLWRGVIELDTPAAFRFQPLGDPDRTWGAPEPAVLPLPVGESSACGESEIFLSGVEPGAFLFTLDVGNAVFSVVQTATQAISGMAVQGNFIATNAPPPNMTWLGDASWESDHHITNSGAITLRFAAQNNSNHWGATNTFASPASGSLAAASTNYVQVTGVSPGRYRITFNHRTGAFGFRQLYPDDSGLNLLHNPGFEITTLPDGGDAADWESSQAWPRRVADGYAPHSGDWCGAMGNGSFAQEVSVVSGETYRASAWLKATPAGISNSMQIQIRWLDATNGNLGPWAIADVPGLTTRWAKYSAEGTAPFAATKARVVFLCPNDGPFDCMHVDDAEMRASDRRSENFIDWTDPAYAVPGDHSRYDWRIQSAGISTGGVFGSLSALLAPTNGAIVSPAFADGVGRTLFWAKAVDTNFPAYLLLQTTTNGSDWTTQASFAATNSVVLSSWLPVAASGAQARIVFDPAKTSGSVLVDDILISAPTLHRVQDFDDWPTKNAYAGSATHQGWFITNCLVNDYYADHGQSARLSTNIGNYIQSPELPDGIGTISFRTRKALDSDGAATVQVQLSTNGADWTTTTSVSPASTNHQSFAYFLQDATNRHVRLYHSAGAFRILIDDIQVGVPHPRPEAIVSCDLDPAYPVADEPMAITAHVATRDEATLLSVTGYYRVASGTLIAVPMVAAGEGAYVSVSNIPAQSAGTRISHHVQVQYAGLGAATNSTGYGTNTIATSTGSVFVATLPRGRVWINELFYAPYDLEPWSMLDVEPWWELVGCNHEYLELCGRAGADIGGWTIQLAFGRDADIAAHGGQPIYASYAIPAETVFADQTNGFGFYVLGDAELIDSGEPIDQVLTTLVPTNISLYSELYGAAGKDHFHDGVGVIRLLDQFSNVVYSLSYNGDVPGADPIAPVQLPAGETNSIGLSGNGAGYGLFEWGKGGVTIGSPNANQTLAYPYAAAWHVPGQQVAPLDTNQVPPFFQFNPAGAGHFDAIDIYSGYTNASYPNPTGILFHRPGAGAAPWTPVAMNVCTGSLDADGHAYVSGRIPAHAYQRLQILEYVVKIDPHANGLDPVYLGSDAGDPGVSAAFPSFAEAEAHPFAYSIPIADSIAITNLLVGASNIILQTTGNDPVDPITHFHVKFTTDLLLPANEWTGTNFMAAKDILSNDSFEVQTDTSIWPKVFFRIDPLWP